MNEPGDIALRLPKPGKALKLVLGLVIAGAIAGAVFGETLMRWLAFLPGDLIASIHDRQVPHVWAFVTSGLLTPPDVINVIFILVALYVGTPDLERRWGGPRFLRFLAISVAMGNLFVLAGYFIPMVRFKQPLAVGPLAAIVAITVAWAKENWTAQTRFLGVIPMSGKTLYWLSLAGSLAAAVVAPGFSEGVLAPLGGFVAGVLFAGNPSPARAAWLRFRLGRMRKQAGSGAITVSDLLGDMDTPRSSSSSRGDRPSVKRSAKAPPLRILQGGLDDELKNRKVPKDKRYLN